MSKHHQEGLAHLLYGIKQGGGFIALTGEVGTGKTTLCQCLLQQLPDNVDIALILNPKLNAIELLATICDELHISYHHEKLTLKDLVDNLNKYLLAAHADGKQTVLMIDEAQNLSLDVLEQIRLLTNLETRKTKLLQIILVAQPELKLLLDQPELRQLNQRITARYHLTPLSYVDTQKYIKHRLKVCGGKTNIFSRSAIQKVFRLSNGIPRLINILCDRALLGAYVLNTQFVTKKIVKKAAKEVLNDLPKSNLHTIVFGLILTVSLAVFLLFLVPDKPKKNHVILAGTFSKPALQIAPKPISLAKQVPFFSYIKQQASSLNVAISKLNTLWNNETPLDSGCEALQTQGLHCLFEKSDWKTMIALNRPVIMEFSISDSEKAYTLLVGLEKGNPVFGVKTKTMLPLEQVLEIWDGYFMVIWQPPVKGVTEVFPRQSSEAVIWIRKHINLNWDDSLVTSRSTYYDNKLKANILKFQQQHDLTKDGIIGAKTFIHLKNNSPLNHSPQLKLID
jgi:general secretion pathway protein A